MNTDPISDLLTRLRNATKAQKSVVAIDHSKMKEHILEVMKNKKFIDDFVVEEEGPHKILKVKLSEKHPNLHVKRISKPGQRIYIKTDELKQVKSGLGITILSTPKGVMSNLEARKQHLGGEMLCEVY